MNDDEQLLAVMEAITKRVAASASLNAYSSMLGGMTSTVTDKSTWGTDEALTAEKLSDMMHSMKWDTGYKVADVREGISKMIPTTGTSNKIRGMKVDNIIVDEWAGMKFRSPINPPTLTMDTKIPFNELIRSTAWRECKQLRRRALKLRTYSDNPDYGCF